MDDLVIVVQSWMNKYAYQLHIEQKKHKFHHHINVISSPKRATPYKRTTFTTLSMSYHLQKKKTLQNHNFRNPHPHDYLLS